ncbi:MAG: hypothetical protein KKB77_03040 [Bacteroidetes bacterium]|nr:hypothetical protein [Bacteroidota bacterium]MBU2460538.1 hypothetical protein [Patescibacteria group bacterium]
MSIDSAPGAIQSFFASLGVVVALEELHPGIMETDPKKLIAATALITLGFIVLGEMIPVMIKSLSFNYHDVVTETVGMIPTLVLLNNTLVTNRRKGWKAQGLKAVIMLFMAQITIDDFSKCEIRVGKVVKAEDVAESRKKSWKRKARERFWQ